MQYVYTGERQFYVFQAPDLEPLSSVYATTLLSPGQKQSTPRKRCEREGQPQSETVVKAS